MDTADASEKTLATIVDRYDHVSIAVRDFGSMEALVQLIGATEVDGGYERRADFHWIQYRMPGDAVLELIRTDSTSPDHFINRFIADRGEGLHHITFKVSDIADARRACLAAGFRVVGYDDTEPAWQELFLHPDSTHGVLIQFAASSG
jgi:methylmalonyl-CoA/ethylmalonyl-CoA epimerase